jgi:malonyl-CoA O-methyltransferase
MLLPAPGLNNPHEAEIQVKISPKRLIARSFGRKAATYGRYATVQSELVRLLVAKLARLPDRGTWIDAGCGAGMLAEQCREAGISSKIIGLDIAFEPLSAKRCFARSPVPVVQADIDNLPLKSNSFDGVITASTFQWLGDPLYVLHGFTDILKPGGFLALSVFVDDSFIELFTIRAYFGLLNILHCIELSAFVKILDEAGFTGLEYKLLRKKVYAQNAFAHLKSISGIGGTVVTGKRLTRTELAEFCQEYETHFRTDEGVPLTYCALIGICRKGNRS